MRPRRRLRVSLFGDGLLLAPRAGPGVMGFRSPQPTTPPAHPGSRPPHKIVICNPINGWLSRQQLLGLLPWIGRPALTLSAGRR
jgi:hypothetical protein